MRIVKTPRAVRLAAIALAVGASISIAAPATGPTAIILDTFNGPDGVPLNGGSPGDANLPGGTYATFGLFGAAAPQLDSSAGNPKPSAATFGSDVTSVPIASNGTYIKPASFTISADVQLGNFTATAAGINVAQRGIGLGFFAAGAVDQTDPDAANSFIGIFLNVDGSLSLDVAGTDTAIGKYDAGKLGALSTDAFYKLSYTVTTATGAISNVKLTSGKGTVTYPVTTTAFTDTATMQAAFESTGDTQQQEGHVDNFSVTTP